MQFDLESKEIKQVKLAERGEHQIGYSNFIVENAYRNEIDEFFNVVYKHKAQIYGFKEDLEVLQLIDNLEK
jgi:hypothetical protein